MQVLGFIKEDLALRLSSSVDIYTPQVIFVALVLTYGVPKDYDYRRRLKELVVVKGMTCGCGEKPCLPLTKSSATTST